ncbi:unnamed protein product [Medioppia subpectinata]|uniref:C2H2-type domain-containing protein n=1 Tax=Medioppia subpectinata TaxID=1979941 RepID=A0A7R9L337_9ACAR|nr:unnamed protein product [Medioppia subpectinata]CAG2114395.1 unnamed protein product [Medioppia subpectinata]
MNAYIEMGTRRDPRRPLPPSKTAHEATVRDRSPLRPQHNCTHGSDTWPPLAPSPPVVSSTSRRSPETTVVELQKQINALTADRTRLSEDNQTLRAALEETDAKLALKTRELTIQVNTLKSENALIVKERAELSAKVADNKKFLDFYKQKKDKELTLKTGTTVKELANERKRIKHLEQQIQTMIAEKDKDRKSRSEMKADLMTAQKARDQTEEKYRQLVRKYKETREKFETYKRGIRAAAEVATVPVVVADTRQQQQQMRDLKEQCQRAEQQLMASRQLVTELETKVAAQQKSFDVQLGALKRQNKHFQDSANMSKIRLVKVEYLLQRVDQMHKLTSNRVADTVDNNGDEVMDEIAAAVKEVLDRKRIELNERNTAAAADGARQMLIQREVFEQNADRISTNPNEKKNCPEPHCDKQYVGHIHLQKHIAAKHPYLAAATIVSPAVPMDTTSASMSTSYSSTPSNSFRSTAGPSATPSRAANSAHTSTPSTGANVTYTSTPIAIGGNVIDEIIIDDD